LVLRRQVIITAKAELEMALDSLTEDEVFESIVNAHRIAKTMRSRVAGLAHGQKLYVIRGKTYANIEVYTKGKLVRDDGHEVFYVLISSKSAL
jgi:hypothetical protein